MFAASIESWVIVSDSPVMVAYIIVFRVSFVEASVRMRVAISIVYLPVTIVARVWVVRMMITAVMVMVVVHWSAPLNPKKMSMVLVCPM